MESVYNDFNEALTRSSKRSSSRRPFCTVLYLHRVCLQQSNTPSSFIKARTRSPLDVVSVLSNLLLQRNILTSSIGGQRIAVKHAMPRRKTPGNLLDDAREEEKDISTATETDFEEEACIARKVLIIKSSRGSRRQMLMGSARQHQFCKR
ncbi:hypothetical protein M0R45_032813 [Rubus argutus]|uniref:Uncharacterized protein n=1 Tax=Rubus argutus TaxID=59490 RepID=A0AAW1WKW7_RUBAR